MKIKIKKLHPDAKMPTQGTTCAGGYDLYASQGVMLLKDVPTKVPTGIAIEIPEGHAGFIMTRSSTALKGVHVSQTLIDADYRGELFITATKTSGFYDRYDVKIGDRIAQLFVVPLPALEFEWADELSETERGTGSYGSTGR